MMKKYTLYLFVFFLNKNTLPKKAFFFEWIRDIFSRSKWIRVTKKVGNPCSKEIRGVKC